ncbi:MAG: class I SAM-dependent rRNA methyltransferase [Betaproteobacteria bacterium]
MAKLVLRPGREKALKRRHPWIFSGAVARVEGGPVSGETVETCSSSGELLAVAAYSPQSQIRARVWDWHDRVIDRAFFEERIRRAVAARATLVGTVTDAVRLVNAEADGLPGVVADRYGDTVVLQLTSAGAERWREEIGDALLQVTGTARVWERSDADVRILEGLTPRCGIVCGSSPVTPTVIHEHALQYQVEIESGHKTGFYLDQRDNRLRLRALAADRDVLDCFAYSGGFTLNALAGGAKSVTAVESSEAALALARANAELNGLPPAQWLEGDVFQRLRQFRDASREFDLIVLDPPKFAPTAGHADRASRAYKDINLLAFKLLRPGGVLMTFSCSGGISSELFQKIVAAAAIDAGADARIDARLHAAPDHTVALNFPEGEYLKGLLCRVAG